MQPLRREFLIYGAVAVLIAALGAAFTAGTVLGPFRQFVAHMRSRRRHRGAARALRRRT